jgi:hypothetical protein
MAFFGTVRQHVVDKGEAVFDSHLLAVVWHEDQSKGSKVLALPMASLSTVASGLLTLLASRGKSQ